MAKKRTTESRLKLDGDALVEADPERWGPSTSSWAILDGVDAARQRRRPPRPPARPAEPGGSRGARRRRGACAAAAAADRVCARWRGAPARARRRPVAGDGGRERRRRWVVRPVGPTGQRRPGHPRPGERPLLVGLGPRAPDRSLTRSQGAPRRPAPPAGRRGGAAAREGRGAARHADGERLQQPGGGAREMLCVQGCSGPVRPDPVRTTIQFPKSGPVRPGSKMEATIRVSGKPFFIFPGFWISAEI